MLSSIFFSFVILSIFLRFQLYRFVGKRNFVKEKTEHNGKLKKSEKADVNVEGYFFISTFNLTFWRSHHMV